MHYFWKNITHLTPKPWSSPIACKYKHLKNTLQKISIGTTEYPQWRDVGVEFGKVSGCHFSNCYANEDQFEYRKRSVYTKKASYNFNKIAFNDSIMPEELKDLKSIFEEFGLL